MNTLIEIAWRALLVGVGATVVMDAWAICQKRAFGIPSLNYAYVGRWIGHFAHGRFFHGNIAKARAIRGEAALGWAAHYLIGVAFAALLLAIWGVSWARQPTLGPALAVGLVTVLAPFFLMQPAMGFGVAASKTPNPNTARFRSLVAHSAYGVGLYVSGWFWAVVLKI